MLVTEPEGSATATLGVIGRALQGGLDAVLLRRPHETAADVFDMARRLRPATRRHGCLLLVSDRADVAVAADADGVHLGARSLPLAAARRVVGPQRMLGRSVHNLDEAGQMDESGVDYLLFGHLFETMSHPGEPPLGLDAYREAVLRARVPVIGIGGVTGENVRLVAQAGGRGAAAIGAFYNVTDPAETARAFRAAFGP
jgi:thiamine-phosphate pyrophosphorylase